MPSLSNKPMVPLSPDEIIKVKEYAYDLLTWKDIAYLLGRPVCKFKMAIDDVNHPVHQAYHAGKVERKRNLRIPILKLAEMGSPQAELLADKYLHEQDIAEADD